MKRNSTLVSRRRLRGPIQPGSSESPHARAVGTVSGRMPVRAGERRRVCSRALSQWQSHGYPAAFAIFPVCLDLLNDEYVTLGFRNVSNMIAHGRPEPKFTRTLSGIGSPAHADSVVPQFA